jgi:hypothetical protein
MWKSSLKFGEYNFDKYNYIKAPEPKKNGGLYTGEEFNRNKNYGNFKTINDVDFLMGHNLKSALGPDEARFHYPGYTRPGNNYQQSPGLVKVSKEHNIYAISNKEIYNSKMSNEWKVEPFNPVSKYEI